VEKGGKNLKGLSFLYFEVPIQTVHNEATSFSPLKQKKMENIKHHTNCLL